MAEEAEELEEKVGLAGEAGVGVEVGARAEGGESQSPDGSNGDGDGDGDGACCFTAANCPSCMTAGRV